MEDETQQNPGSTSAEHPNYLSFCTFNIMSGGNSRLETALRMLRMKNIDFGVLTETKLVNGFHTKKYEGYEITTTNATSRFQGGVAFFYNKVEIGTSRAQDSLAIMSFKPN